jgi:hypothetical protein
MIALINSIVYYESFKQPTNLVMITSVIHTIDKPLRSNLDSYIHPRSVISHEDRYKQTLETIKSVKAKIPDSFIVLIEGSPLTKEEQDSFYETGCDYIFDESEILKDVINSDSKSLGETYMLLGFLESSYFKNLEFQTLSKISGRYYLTDNFDFHKYPLDKVVCQCPISTVCNTRYYRIPSHLVNTYISSLKEFQIDPDLLNYKTDIEHYNIFKVFKEEEKIIISRPNILGVKGITSPWNGYVEDFQQL